MSSLYILLKDLPDGSKIGDTYKLLPGESPIYINTKYGYPHTSKDIPKHYNTFVQDTVENSPEWFEEKQNFHCVSISQTLKSNNVDSFVCEIEFTQPIESTSGLTKKIIDAINFILSNHET